MTTNKPEELAWTWMYRKIRRVTTDYSRALCLSEPPYSIKIEPLIRLSEYEALQAECERLRKDADRWREIRKGGDSVRVVFTDWDAMKDYVLSNEEADAAIDAAMQTGNPC